MRNERNSAEYFRAATVAKPMEGMECGSLDRFQHSANDDVGGRQMEVLTIRTTGSSWKPADDFWSAFQIFDPGGVHEYAWRTDISAAWFNKQAVALRDAPVPSRRERLERRKAMTCLGLTKMIILLEDGCAGYDDINVLRRQLAEFMLTSWKFFDPDQETPLVAAIIDVLPESWKRLPGR